ncbi:conserved domain protein [Streptococcus infantis SK970]|nr:conserved domain protein [Streptococcus infantis SK970]
MEYYEFKEDIIDQNFNLYFDTSALLSMYRKQQDLVDYFDVNIRSINNDIRIPSTVQKEYNRNVSGAKDHLKNELIKNTKNFQKNIFDRVNQSLKQISELLSNSDSPVLDTFVELQSDSIGKLSAINDFIRILEISENEEKTDKVSELMDNFLMLPDNILPKISRVEQIKMMNEGYTRAKHHFPPGYMDMKDKYHGLKKKL